MEDLKGLLDRLQARHRAALEWFFENAGTEQPWPKPISDPGGKTLLTSKPKGIYKPAWSKYALSVRQSLDSSYPDREPIVRSNGTWFYAYFQENADASAGENEFTNRGLIECWRDRVPVGVLRQVSRKPRLRYRVLGLALVAGTDGGYFFLEGFAPNGNAHSPGPAGEIEHLTKKLEDVVAGDTFDPQSTIDGRERVLAEVVRRRGQPEFRRKLLETHGSRCVISGCTAVEALEAAHITPYRGGETNCLENGLLLRADIHTLFDLGLIAIDPDTMAVLLSPSIISSSYGELAGRQVRLPEDHLARPSREALAAHRRWSGL